MLSILMTNDRSFSLYHIMDIVYRPEVFANLLIWGQQ